MITPIPVLQPFSCHGTHRITFADHCLGQMQLTSQRERSDQLQALPETARAQRTNFPVTPVFIHEITGTWDLTITGEYCMSFISPILRNPLSDYHIWSFQQFFGSTRTYLYALTYDHIFTVFHLPHHVFISNLKSMIYHHNHYFNFLALSHSGKIPIPIKGLSVSTSHLQCANEYGWNSTQNACYFFPFYSWLSIFLGSTATDSSNCIRKIFRKKNSRGFPSTPVVKNHPTMQGCRFEPLVRELDPTCHI